MFGREPVLDGQDAGLAGLGQPGDQAGVRGDAANLETAAMAVQRAPRTLADPGAGQRRRQGLGPGAGHRRAARPHLGQAGADGGQRIARGHASGRCSTRTALAS